MLAAGMIMMTMVLSLGLKESEAGSKGTVLVSANVLPKLTQTTVRQEAVLTITKEDAAKGCVDIEAGTILHVKSNDQNGYFLNFLVDGQWIKKTDVKINGRSVSVQSGAGLIHQRFPGVNGETVQITYRLFLSPGMKPGSYQWPVMVAATLM